MEKEICSNSVKQFLQKQLMCSRISLLVGILSIVVIGELGRLGMLPDARNISPVVQGIQGLLFVAWVVFHVFEIKNIKNNLGLDLHEYADIVYLKKQSRERWYLRFLMMALILSGAINNSIFAILAIVSIVIALHTLRNKKCKS